MMIDAELAGFLEEGIAIELATRNGRLEPHGVRIVAAVVEDDGNHLVAYVPAISAPQVLPDLESNGLAALVFSRPPDERSCQVKGTFVGARPSEPADLSVVQTQWERWLDRLAGIGIPRKALEHWHTWPCIAIRVRVTAIFNQTPGPGAGARLA
jgi:hypothetical protein